LLSSSSLGSWSSRFEELFSAFNADENQEWNQDNDAAKPGLDEQARDPVASLEAALNQIESGEPLYGHGHVSRALVEAALLKYGLDAGISWRRHDNLFELVKFILPQDNSLSSSTAEASSFLRDISPPYRVIHVCPQDCCAYTGPLENETECIKDTCGMPRFKLEGSRHKPRKVFYSWAVASSAVTMFSSQEKVGQLTAHSRMRSKDGVIRSLHGKFSLL
jgi:hypothetical protein